MDWIFLLCAIFGGTVLVAQFLLGFGGEDEALDDGPEDAPDAIGEDGNYDQAHGDHGEGVHHDSTWLFGVLTLRTILIGVTFFGLTGKAAAAWGLAPPRPLLVAIACGLASMYGMYFLMRAMMKLTSDGTERIGRSVGEEATVYLSVPGHNQGVGKILVTVQNRTLEYEAMTSGERLPTGSRALVVGVISSDRVEVEPAIEPTPITEPAGNSNG